MKHILIVGGGAAGLAAAAFAAAEGARVTVCESGSRVGQKILKTGNGRCNLSNTNVSPEAYNHPEFVGPVLGKYGCGYIRSFFSELGLETYEEDGGRIYPISNTAASVLDVLRLALDRYGVKVVDSFDAVRIDKHRVFAKDGRAVSCDSVIAAAGGGSRVLSGAGHAMIPFSPVLCPLSTDTQAIRGLSGIRVKCLASLIRNGKTVVCEAGEVLFRDYGVSGIAVFDLSRYAKQGDILSLDLMPEAEPGKVRDILSKRESELSWRGRENMLTGLFHKRINEALIRACGTDTEKLGRAVKDFRLEIHGAAEPKQAQLTRGGADIRQFDPETMRSKKHDWLYAAGEALDIDGRCGGYNLHWAFASGICAAESAL